MNDFFADIFLAFSHVSVIFLILLTGFFLSRAVFFQAFVLGTFNIVMNVTLKGIFKVPLSPSLHKIGYAFPSGHMQLSTVIYVWLALCIVSWPLRVSIFLILLGIGAGLVHYDYHTWFEVIAGFVCGLSLVGFMRYGLVKCANLLPWILLVCATILIFCNNFLYQHIPQHAIIAYGVLVCLIILERFFAKNAHRQNFWLRTSLPS